MERIETSFCSFEGVVRKCTYVDKADMLWRLVSDADEPLFAAFASGGGRS